MTGKFCFGARADGMSQLLRYWAYNGPIERLIHLIVPVACRTGTD